MTQDDFDSVLEDFFKFQASNSGSRLLLINDVAAGRAWLYRISDNGETLTRVQATADENIMALMGKQAAG